MSSYTFRVLAALCIIVAFNAQHSAAHGDHIWFVSPKKNASVTNDVMFKIEAPYASNKYIHLKVTKAGQTMPALKTLVELNDQKYTIKVDVRNWISGEYKAEIVLLGALFQHPVSRKFVVE